MVHELKTWPVQFQAMLDDRKRHEVRNADRDFREGDKLRLREWEPLDVERHGDQLRALSGRYTGRVLYVKVGWVTERGAWGLPPTVCCMSVLPVSAAEADLLHSEWKKQGGEHGQVPAAVRP